MNEPYLVLWKIYKPEIPAISHSKIILSDISRYIIAWKSTYVLASFQEPNYCGYSNFQENFLFIKRFRQN